MGYFSIHFLSRYMIFNTDFKIPSILKTLKNFQELWVLPWNWLVLIWFQNRGFFPLIYKWDLASKVAFLEEGLSSVMRYAPPCVFLAMGIPKAQNWTLAHFWSRVKLEILSLTLGLSHFVVVVVGLIQTFSILMVKWSLVCSCLL